MPFLVRSRTRKPSRVAMIRKPSCLISCSQSLPLGGSGAGIGRQGLIAARGGGRTRNAMHHRRSRHGQASTLPHAAKWTARQTSLRGVRGQRWRFQDKFPRQKPPCDRSTRHCPNRPERSRRVHPYEFVAGASLAQGRSVAVIAIEPSRSVYGPAIRHCRAEAQRSVCLRSTSPETTVCACPACARPRSACGHPRGLRPICR